MIAALLVVLAVSLTGCGGITIAEEMRASKEACAPSTPQYMRWSGDTREVEVLVCEDGRVLKH
jgi:hypothetical protein